jgi:hypothetical protein
MQSGSSKKTQMGHVSFSSMLMMIIYWVKTNINKKNTKALLNASKKVGLGVNIEKTKYVLMTAFWDIALCSLIQVE